HPIVLVKAIVLTIWFALNVTGDIWITSLAIVDWLTIICAYIGFIALCWKSTDGTARRYLRTRQLLVPVYWVAISMAAWRALHQLIYDPYRWEKTPHTRHEKSP
ncbi:MAG: glycosyl transferase family 2, partial [Pseudomonadota bacterium]